jgi:hypothetical protein
MMSQEDANPTLPKLRWSRFLVCRGGRGLAELYARKCVRRKANLTSLLVCDLLFDLVRKKSTSEIERAFLDAHGCDVGLWAFSRNTGLSQKEEKRRRRQKAKQYKQLRRRQRQLKRGFITTSDNAGAYQHYVPIEGESNSDSEIHDDDDDDDDDKSKANSSNGHYGDNTFTDFYGDIDLDIGAPSGVG